MSPVLLVKIKGWLTLVAGVLFVFIPVQVVAIMGGELGDAGMIFAQLFGLVLLALGWVMAFTPHAVPSGSEALSYAGTDMAAIVLLVLAVNRGVFGPLGFALAAVYALSACLFIYCYLAGSDRAK